MTRTLTKRQTKALERHLLKPGGSSALVASWLGRYANARTRKAYADAIRRAAALLEALDPVDIDWPKIETDDLSRIRMGLAKLYRPSTAGLTWMAVTGILKQAWRLGLLPQRKLARLLDEPKPTGKRMPAGRALEVSELELVAAACETPGNAAARAGAIFALGYGGGLREAEIAGLAVTAIERSESGASVRVIGKGDKERRVELTGKTAAFVERWLAVRGSGGEALVCALSRKGRPLVERPLSPNAIWHVLSDLCERSGIAHASPHDLRRTFATQLFDAGADVYRVQRLMGHASPATTEIYDRRPDRDLRETVDRLPVLGSDPSATPPHR